MDLALNIQNLNDPRNVAILIRAIQEIAAELDVLYVTTAPNGNISARIGRIALYYNDPDYEIWVNTDGGTTWKQMDYQAVVIPWELDGSEIQLVTAYPIDMQTKKIINLVDPSSNQDASTKKYVDDYFNTSTGHDHDGSDSKKVIATNLNMTGLTNGYFLYNNGGTLGAKANPSMSNNVCTITEEVLHSGDGTFQDAGYCKFTKLNSQSTLQVHARMKVGGGGEQAATKITINGSTTQLNNTTGSTTYTWYNTSIDISGLTNDTEYEIKVEFGSVAGANQMGLFGFSLLAE